MKKKRKKNRERKNKMKTNKKAEDKKISKMEKKAYEVDLKTKKKRIIDRNNTTYCLYINLKSKQKQTEKAQRKLSNHSGVKKKNVARKKNEQS